MIKVLVREVRAFNDDALLNGYLHSNLINIKVANKCLDNRVFLRLIDAGLLPLEALKVLVNLLQHFHEHVLMGAEVNDLLRLGEKYLNCAATQIKLHTLNSMTKITV
ncbi:hypothetical protein ACJZRZ_000965 [Vibrio parahaemolyticus]